MGEFVAKPLVRLMLALIAAALLAGGAMLVLRAITGGKAAQVTARLNANQAEAIAASGNDAVNTAARVAASSETGDAIHQENADAIQNAPGAAAPVDPRLRDAGLAGLCRHAAYRREPRCLQFAPAR